MLLFPWFKGIFCILLYVNGADYNNECGETCSLLFLYMKSFFLPFQKNMIEIPKRWSKWEKKNVENRKENIQSIY